MIAKTVNPTWGISTLFNRLEKELISMHFIKQKQFVGQAEEFKFESKFEPLTLIGLSLLQKAIEGL